MSSEAQNRRSLYILSACALGILLLGTAVWNSSRSINETETTLPNEPVAAVINGRPLLESDVVYAIENLNQNANDVQQRDAILQTLIDQRLLAEHARSLNLQDARPLQSRLRIAEEQILAEASLKNTGDAAISNEVLRRLYDEQAQLRQRGIEVRARQILLPDRETADEVLKKLDNGDAFPTLAVAYSLDRVSRDSGGDLGFIARDSYPEEFTGPVFSTGVGERAELFETARGWHIVEVTDRRQAPTPSFEEMKDDLAMFLRAQAVEQLLTDLKSKASIDIIQPGE